MSTKDENLSKIAEMVTPETFARILEKNYSDRTLDFIAPSAAASAAFANSHYNTESVEKLMKAKDTGLIDQFDVMHIMKSSEATIWNERYMDDFLTAIRRGMSPSAAVNAFIAANNERLSFDRTTKLFSSGVYIPKNDRLILTQGIAWELHDLGITLTADAIDYKYTVEDVAASYGNGHFIRFEDNELALKIAEMRFKPDWTGFKEFLKGQLDGSMDKLTPFILDSMEKKYQKVLISKVLSDKVMGEYEAFIADIKTKSPDEIVSAAYEIVQKDNITDFFSFNSSELSREDIDILLESDDILDKTYQKYFDLTQQHGLIEINTAVEETAYELKSDKALQLRAQELAAKQQKSVSIKKPIPNLNTSSIQPQKPIKHRGR